MYSTFTKLRLTVGCVLAAVMAGCSASDRPTAPRMGPAFAISDAAHAGGTAGFFFLPPMAAPPAVSGTLDADIVTLDPQVAICDITDRPDVDCGGSGPGATPAVIVYTTASTPAIDVDGAKYQVNWDTKAPGFLAAHSYRVHVTAGATEARRELGFADVLLTTTPGQAKDLATEDLITLNDGRTLPIHFRIETGIQGGIAVSAATSSITTGGTDLITATVQDLHGTPLVGAAVAWSLTTTPAADVAGLDASSGQTGGDGTAATTLTAGGTPGTALVTAASTGLTAAVSIAVRAALKPLYVANVLGSSITVYAPGARDDATPTATIVDGTTGLSGPWAVALDAAGNIYVANPSVPSITVYAAGSNGDAAPTATITGLNTGLSFPAGITLDAAGRIYVANGVSNSITIYAAGANGDVAPTATIVGGSTGLDFPVGIAVDAAGNLYVANASGGSVTMYAAGAHGDAAPTATIVGGNTGLNFPVGIARDQAGRLYVSNGAGNTITIYEPHASGDATPIASISGGATGLDFPWGIALDGVGQLYVANANGNSITVYAAGASDNAAPTATIVGGSTGLNQPFGITF